MGCCEVKPETYSNYETELNVVQNENSFNEMSISSDECRATTNPIYWANTMQSTRPRSTSYSYSNRIELAFLISSPIITKQSEATKSVLIPFSENSIELDVIKEEEKDITLSFEETPNTNLNSTSIKD
jgi:hypothetical protein